MTCGIYIHVPFCLHRCRYCTFYSTTDAVPGAGEYAAALEVHLEQLTPHISRHLVFDTVYFGGGTPSCMPPVFFKQVLEFLQKRIPMHGDPEITVEMNPETVDREYLAGLKQAGVNRVSIGIQSMDPAVLNRLGRVHSAETAERTVLIATELFDNVSVDFMIGIAGMAADPSGSISPDLLEQVQHVSVYILEGDHVREMQMDEDSGAAQYLTVCDYLENHGLIQYEISNFSRPGFHSRHNVHYWHGDPYLGLGPSAHSYLDGSRLAEEAGLTDFMDGSFQLTENRVDQESRIREEIMLALRLRTGIDLQQIPGAFRRVMSGELKALSRRFPDLLAGAGTEFRLTRKGMLLSNEIFERVLFPDRNYNSEMGDS